MLAALVLALALSFAAQQSTGDSQVGASRTALANVFDIRNRPLVDVGADDFVIQEAGVAREVLSVRPADYPIVVLLDTGIEARDDLPVIRKAVAHFIDRIGQRPLAIGTIGENPRIVATFDDERGTMLERLDAVAAAGDAGSSPLQAAALAGQTIRSTGTLFSAIVILSATSADASQGTPESLMSPVIDSGAIMHVVANRSGSQTTAAAARPAESLRSLSEQTHGDFTTIYSSASYQAALDRLADRLTSEVMIEYLVPVGSKPIDVKLGVRIVGARVRGLGVAPK